MATKLVLVSAVLSAAAFFGGRAARPEIDRGYVELARVHYAKVERELASADVSGLTQTQRAARARVIGALAAYRERGDYGRSYAATGERVPLFVDDLGRRCAVAELLHATGEDALVSRVAARANSAWIADLADDAEFGGWLDRTGLTVAEAARIQAPAIYRGPRPSPPPPPDRRSSTQDSAPNDSGPQPESSGGSSSSTPSNPTSTGTGGGSSSGAAGGRAANGAGGSGAAGPAAEGSGAGGTRDITSGADASSWWLWWEYSKLDYVTAHPIGERDADVPVNGGATRRARALAVFETALSDPDSAVRGAAAVALGRAAGESAVARILPLLADADSTTRERAILALGATGSKSGSERLLRIAAGTPSQKDGAPSADARALAIVSLALARRYGLEESFDEPLAKLVDGAKKRDLDSLATAALVHRLLVPGKELDRVALRVALDVNAPQSPRTRAVESLGARADVPSASALRDLIGDRHVELRRSAAIALGFSKAKLTVEQMKTAYELETEPFARGLLLVSLGRAGGLTALDFLREELRSGPATLRPWAAIGLGLVARPDADIEATAALRGAELPASERGAVWIAQGLARDASAVTALIPELRGAQSPVERAHAATALALIGNDASRDALVAALKTEEAEFTRVIIAWGLGSIGRAEDAPAILSTVESLQDSGLSPVASVALGLHGSATCLDGALHRAADTTLPAAARAAAIEAAGLLLSRHPGLVLHEISRATNFAVMPRWMRSALMVTL